jgi:hypothetical protein
VQLIAGTNLIGGMRDAGELIQVVADPTELNNQLVFEVMSSRTWHESERGLADVARRWHATLARAGLDPFPFSGAVADLPNLSFLTAVATHFVRIVL